MSKTYEIIIRELKVDAIIGIHAHEKALRQPLIITLHVTINPEDAITTDAIESTLDYHALSLEIIDYVQKQSYQLLETLLDGLLGLVSTHKHVLKATIEIAKPEALKELGAVVAIKGVYN